MDIVCNTLLYTWRGRPASGDCFLETKDARIPQTLNSVVSSSNDHSPLIPSSPSDENKWELALQKAQQYLLVSGCLKRPESSLTDKAFVYVPYTNLNFHVEQILLSSDFTQRKASVSWISKENREAVANVELGL